MYKIVKSFNGGYCTLIEKDGEFYAYEEREWNGEYYHNAWHSDKFGDQLEDDKARYHVKPIIAGVGEPNEDGEYESYEEVDVEIERV